MTVEFVVLVDRTTYPQSQEMPDVFLEECYNGKKHVYLTSYKRIRTKVSLVKACNGSFALKGHKWRSFAKENIGSNVQVLHFIEEGDDSFYVTGYDYHGREFGGYEGIQGRPSRFKSRVWADENRTPILAAQFLTGLALEGNIAINVEEHQFTVPVIGLKVGEDNMPEEYALNSQVWNVIKATLFLERGMMLVFTKEQNLEFWMQSFLKDGSPFNIPHFLGATTLLPVQPAISFEDKDDDRMHHIYRWPAHRDHFRESEDTFYKRFSYNVVRKRLAILAEFLENHPMHTYNKALMKHQNVECTMTIKMEFHKEDPERTNHINVLGEWDEFGHECRFAYDKMIRFRYMFMLTNINGNEVEEYPVFHLC